MDSSRAIVLGAVQGPTELLPVSSSAHLTLIPWLAEWDDGDRDPELQKSFEVALHVGAAGALLVGQRRVIVEELRSFDARRAAVLALSFLPAGSFTAEIWQDGPNAAKYGSDWQHVSQPVNASHSLAIHMAPGGGYLAKIVPQQSAAR